jgi:hypothetical protein
MKYLALWTFLLICLFHIFPAQGADYSIRGGAAITQEQINGGAKIFGIRREAPLVYGIYTAEELGGYVDNVGDGRRGSALGKLGIGLKPGADTGMFGKLFTGPCVISTTDNYLSSHLQFCTDFGVGIRDRQTFVDATYSHISNAGIKLPNRGKDFFVMEAGLRF